MGFFNNKEKGRIPDRRESLEDRLSRRKLEVDSYRMRADEQGNNHFSCQGNRQMQAEIIFPAEKTGDITSISHIEEKVERRAGRRKAVLPNDCVHLEEIVKMQSDQELERKEQEEDVVKRVRQKVKDLFGDRIKEEKNNDKFKTGIREAIDGALKDEGRFVPTVSDRERLNTRIYNLIMGLGPLELLFTQGYSEIMVTRYDKIFVEEKGKLKLTDVRFASEEELCSIIEQMVSRIGRVINDSNPKEDGILEDGSRFNAVLVPIAVDGAQLTIRRFPEKMPTEEDYIKFESLDREILSFLKMAVESKWNLIVSGGTGSGKTSLLNLMSNFLSYDPGLSVVTIEDSCELRINHINVRRYETKAANATGAGGVTSRDLVKNVMRARPDVVIIGEIRDGTMADFLRLNTSGHEGGMTTVHNDSPEKLESTIQVLFQMAKDYNFTENAISRLYANAVDLIIQIKRYSDHVRRISHISHVVGYGKDGAKELGILFKDPDYNPTEVYVRDIFVWRKTGVSENGVFTGKFEATGYVPKGLIEKAEENGVTIDTKLFEPSRNGRCTQ